MKVRDIIRLRQKDGWQHVRTTGSHRHFRNPSKPGTVTFRAHPSDDVAIGTQISILKQAGLR